MEELRILIADDHEVLRHGLRGILQSQPGWRVVAEAANGRQAVELAIQLKPDIAVIDISMPELNGLDATREILRAVPSCEVLIMTLHESEELVRQVLQAGARAYVLKSDAARDLLSAVEALRGGATFFTSSVASIVLQGFLQSSPGKVAAGKIPPALTPRERQVAQLLAEGNSNKQVASSLGISVKTAETHRANLMHKLGITSLSDLVRWAVRNRLTDA